MATDHTAPGVASGNHRTLHTGRTWRGKDIHCVLKQNKSIYEPEENQNPTSYMNPPSNSILNSRLQRYVHQRAPVIGSLLFFSVSSSSSCALLLRMLARPELWCTRRLSMRRWSNSEQNTNLLTLTQTWREYKKKKMRSHEITRVKQSVFHHIDQQTWMYLIGILCNIPTQSRAYL